MNFNFSIPSKVIFGYGRVSDIPTVLDSYSAEKS